MSHLRIVRGNPTDAEVAALVAALASVQRRDAAAATGPAPAAPPAGWSDRAARLRRPLHPGPGAWARSVWPH